MASRWTDAEDAALREHYPRGLVGAMEALPGRNRPAIRHRASQLGIAMAADVVSAQRKAVSAVQGKEWTAEEDALVLKHRPSGREACLKALPHRSWPSIEWRGHVLGIRVSTKVDWTAEEDARLRELWPTTGAAAIGERLRRTPGAVSARACKLGLKRVRPRAAAAPKLAAAPVERKPQPAPRAPKAPSMRSCAAPVLHQWHIAKLLPLLGNLAEHREPLPGAKALGSRCGVSAGSIESALRRLEKAGRIKVELAHRSRRVVLPDGRATEWSTNRGAGRHASVLARIPAAPVLRVIHSAAPVSAGWVERYAALPRSGRGCSWPTWSDDADPVPMPPPYCGEPAVGGHSYCATHCARAFVPARSAA